MVDFAANGREAQQTYDKFATVHFFIGNIAAMVHEVEWRAQGTRLKI